MRRSKSIRRPVPRPAEKEPVGRDAVIAELLKDPWGVLVDEQDHPLLASFAPDERAEILHEVERKQWAERERVRLPILLERLRTQGPDAWPDVFCERPDLEEKLTPEQRAAWRAFVRENRTRLRAGGAKLEYDAKFDDPPRHRTTAPPAQRPQLVARHES